MPETQPGPIDAGGRVSPGEAVPYDLIELLFFAYRDFVGGPDRILAEYGFGRAHHRVLHFVLRRPGLTIAELLDSALSAELAQHRERPERVCH